MNYCKAACTYDDNDITLVWFGILKVYNSLYNNIIYIYIYIYIYVYIQVHMVVNHLGNKYQDNTVNSHGVNEINYCQSSLLIEN